MMKFILLADIVKWVVELEEGYTNVWRARHWMTKSWWRTLG
jgi:hypothetical protein